MKVVISENQTTLQIGSLAEIPRAADQRVLGNRSLKVFI